MPSACDFCDIKIDKLFCQTFLDCNSASNAFYRTKKASLRMLLGFWFYFATQSKCSFACANLFCQTFLHSNCASNACTNHGVVAHADESHHFDVCRDG